MGDGVMSQRRYGYRETVTMGSGEGGGTRNCADSGVTAVVMLP
jgi:hypothetical protein